MQRKIQVMLVDDEYLALEDLKTLIDWNSLGFEICAAARSGRQALQFFENKPSDLIITDISMPGMNGIALIEQLKKKNSKLRFLLLTAYAEIDYMKSAFQLGVEDYLIKDEITPSILSVKLCKIRENYFSSLNQSYSYLQKKLHKYFSDRNTSLPENMPEIPQTGLLYCILAPDVILPWQDVQTMNSKYSISEIIDTALPFAETYYHPELENLCSISAYNNQILVLLKSTETFSAVRIMKNMQCFSSGLIQDLWTQCRVSFSCFYSCTPMDIERLRDDFFFRQKTIRARYFLGHRIQEALDSDKLYITNEKFSLTESTLEEMVENDEQNFVDFIDQAFEKIVSTHNYYGLFHLLNTCYAFFSKHSADGTFTLEQIDLTDMSCIRNYILDHARKLYRDLNSALPYEVRKAIEYMSAHLGEESLSLQEISEDVCLSATHLSRIFKASTGETIWDYLTKLRIQKACQILKNSDAKIYEIAETIGYSSPQYFSQVFYKQMGIKPLDYRKKVRL